MKSLERLSRNRRRPGACPVPLAVLGLAMLVSPFFQARSSPLTNIQTVFVIVMENKDWNSIHGNSHCPYINSTLLPMASRAEKYFTPNDLHPSEPNYIWLEAGTNFGILDDGSPADNRIHSTNHLVTLLEGAGISWKTYQESYNPADSPFEDKYPYAAKHNPFVFFDDVATNPARLAQHVRSFSELASDLKKDTVGRYNFIVPNLTNDMHSPAPNSPSKEKQGDDWLARELPALLSSAAFTNRGAIFLTWDEGHHGRPIGLIVLSPLAKGHGYTNDISYTHSSLLRTVQEIFAVRPLLGDAANAADLSDLFAFDSPSLSAVLDFTNGLARLSLSGLSPGRTNVIQTSTNLADWLPLHTNVATATTLQFTDTINTNGPRRLYRFVELP